MATVRFRGPRERIKVATNKEGLGPDNRILIKGKKKNGSGPRQRTIEESLAALRKKSHEDGGLSEYPDLTMSGSKAKIADLARGDDDLDRSFKHKSKKRKSKSPKKSKSKKRRKAFSDSGSSEGSYSDDDSVGSPPPPRRSMLGNGSAPPAPMQQPRLKMPEVSDSESEESGSFGSVIDDMSSDDEGSDGSGSVSTGSSGSMSLEEARRRRPVPVGKGLGAGLNAKKADKVDVSASASLKQKEAEEAERNDLLARFHVLRQRGVHLSRNFTPKSNLNEMRMEMGRIEHENKMARAVRMNRRFCMIGASGLTNLTNNYAPRVVRGRWDGFDKHLVTVIEEFDGPFERLSEEYGGVVGAMSGGNPLLEIIMLFMYQFITYGISHGAASGKTTEEMSTDEISKRYPNLIREAVEKEMKRREDEKLEEIQREQRRQQYDLYERTQAAAQSQQQQGRFYHYGHTPPVYQPPPQAQPQPYYQPQAHAPQRAPVSPVRPPQGFDPNGFVFKINPDPPVLNQERNSNSMVNGTTSVPPDTAGPGGVNAANQNVSGVGGAFGGHNAPPPMLMPRPDQDNESFMLDKMHAPLPHVDPRDEDYGSHVDSDDSDDTDAMVDSIMHEEQPQEEFRVDYNDNLNLPQIGRMGKSSSMKPPPNKRDLPSQTVPKSPTPFGSVKTPSVSQSTQKKGKASNDQLVVNIA